MRRRSRVMGAVRRVVSFMGRPLGLVCDSFPALATGNRLAPGRTFKRARPGPIRQGASGRTRWWAGGDRCPLGDRARPASRDGRAVGVELHVGADVEKTVVSAYRL